jgi:hypothetical protein
MEEMGIHVVFSGDVKGKKCGKDVRSDIEA